MGHTAEACALRRENLKVRDRSVLLHLAHDQIEERTGSTKRTVRRALRSLDSEGHLAALQEFRL